MRSRLERLRSQEGSLEESLATLREVGDHEQIREATARLAEVKQAIAEAEGDSLTGDGDMRPDG